MADISQAFNNRKEKKYDNTSDNFDHFFTQRKVTESIEFLDTNLNRKHKKNNTVYNFLAINLPTAFTKLSFDHDLHIEIWGDIHYRYTGKICNSEGFFPHFLVRLFGDTQIFIKLTALNGSKQTMVKIGFINIPKRYQVEPESNESKLHIKNNSSNKKNKEKNKEIDKK